MTWTDYVLVNEYITWPDDFLPIVPYTLFFALIHWVIKDRMITVGSALVVNSGDGRLTR
jgi:cell shape-determining protein MreD